MTTHCNCNGNLIPSGNDFYLAIALKSRSLVDGEVVETPFDFEAADTYNARIYGILDGKTLSTMVGLKDGTTDTVIVDAKGVPLIRAIGVEVTGEVDGRAFRAAEKGFLSIVEFNGEARVVFTPVTGGQQANLVMTLTFLPSAAVVGKNAYEIWKEEPGNHDKTLADFIYFLGHGESAYEIAVRYGYTGTEAEYNMLYFDAVDVANTAGQNAQQAADTANEMAAQAQDAAELADAATANANNAATAAAATVDAAIDNMEDTLNAAIAAQDAEIDEQFATQTALINQKQMEIGAVPSDLMPTAGSTNWVTSGGIHSSTPSNENNNSNADFDISDEGGNVIARFENGHIRTKNFNSEIDGQISVGDCSNDLEVADPAGNVLMLLRNGHIMTKEFDSSKLGDEFNYYATEFEAAEQALYDKVRNDIDAKTVVLLITTDAHITTEEPCTLKYAKAFRRMAENIGADAIVSLGDIINEKVGTGWDITANRNRIELYMKDTRNTYIPFLYALAHHEMFSSGYPTFLYGYSAAKVLGKTGKYQRYMKPVFDSANYANFYVDVEPQGLRMIFLDSANVAGHPAGYTQATVDWLTSILSSTTSKIAVFTHVPSKNGYSYNPTNNISKVVNDDLVRTALNTYVQGGGKVLGHYCGHAHCDNYGKESDMEYYIIQTACSVPRVDGGVPSNERPNLGTPIYYSNRTVGTINEWCIDVACIHTDIDEVHLFRFGAGQDRSITL